MKPTELMTIHHGDSDCPFCKEDDRPHMVHIENVRVFPVQGKMDVAITRCGVQSRMYDNSNGDCRGITIETGFWCESGHRWIERRWFYKGSTCVAFELMETVTDEDRFWNDLWRD